MSFRPTRAHWAFLTVVSFAIATPVVAQQDTVVGPTLSPTFSPTFSLHGFLQTYYRTGDPLTKDGFRLRKADLRFDGDISNRLKWRVVFDAGKALTLTKTVTQVNDTATLSDAAIDQRTKILQDAALTYIVNKEFNLDVGQQLVPLSLEGKTSSAQIETIERTLFITERSRAGGLGDVRDLGVSANGFAFNTIEYHAGVFNETGEDAGSTDPNDEKAMIGRVSIHPSLIPALQFGGSAAYQGGPRSGQRRRGGTEIQYRVPLFTLRAETMTARDGDLRRTGWYGLGALRPIPELQLVARYDSWDRDRGSELSVVDAYERQYVVGGSWALDGSAKIAMNLIRQTFPNVNNVRNGTILLTAFQASW